MAIAFFRTIILYLLIIAGIRLMGKRQVGELEPSELVLSLLIADLAAVPMQDFGIPLVTGVIPILTLLSVTTILSVLSIKSIKVRAVLCGRPSIVIQNGKLSLSELTRNRFTVDELMEEARMQGYPDLTAIHYAVLETNGRLSILPYAAQKPPSARDLGIAVEEPGLPLVVVSDGRVLPHNLKARGFDEVWLQKRLAERGHKSAETVFLLTVDNGGNIYLSPKEVTS